MGLPRGRTRPLRAGSARRCQASGRGARVSPANVLVASRTWSPSWARVHRRARRPGGLPATVEGSRLNLWRLPAQAPVPAGRPLPRTHHHHHHHGVFSKREPLTSQKSAWSAPTAPWPPRSARGCRSPADRTSRATPHARRGHDPHPQDHVPRRGPLLDPCRPEALTAEPVLDGEGHENRGGLPEPAHLGDLADPLHVVRSKWSGSGAR